MTTAVNAEDGSNVSVAMRPVAADADTTLLTQTEITAADTAAAEPKKKKGLPIPITIIQISV